MGCYVNPDHEDKETWLENNATTIYAMNTFPKWETIFATNERPVVLVDNGMFKAAGVAYDEREYQDFTREDDPRPRKIYRVLLEKLKEVSDIETWLKE